MATSSAPGKVYLFGEHAVVYGEPAVPCAIERRATVTVEVRDDDRVRVHAPDLRLDGFTVEYDETGRAPEIDAPADLVEVGLAYVDRAVSRARETAAAPDAGFDVAIESELPLGAGLGSSAAVTVAGLDAATRALGHPLDPETLAEQAYRVEHEVQEGQASRADTFCSATGGAVRVEGDDCRAIEAPDLPLIVGYDGGAGNTGELVRRVRALRGDYDFAADAVRTIGDLVRHGERALAAGDLAEIGRLMDVNHGLLSALGVSGRSLDAMTWTARDAGALGAKLTGAGGAGCIVALDPSGASETALGFEPACEAAFPAALASEGVRRE